MPLRLRHCWPPALPIWLLVCLFCQGAVAYTPASPWAPQAWLGVTVRAASFETLATRQLEYGVLVAGLFPAGPAARAGVQVGDILLELDGRPVYSVERLNWLLRTASSGAKSSLTYHRDGRTETVNVALAPLTPHQAAPPPWNTSGWLTTSYLGVHLQAMTNELRDVFGAPQGEGVLIVKVMPESPASAARLAVGDVLLRMDRRTIRRVPDVHRVLAFFEPGDTVEIELIRERQRQTLTVTLAERSGVGAYNGDWEPPPYSPTPSMQPRHWRELVEELQEIWENFWRDLSEKRMKRVPEYL
ncbi:MAG: PDZ domain-containing protein [Gammaproteobacteria bacterium]|nr:PDZ domain-containing protein [Gammaproteobacteria bacterium]